MQNTTTTEAIEIPETGSLFDASTATAGVMFVVFALVALFVVALSFKSSKAEA